MSAPRKINPRHRPEPIIQLRSLMLAVFLACLAGLANAKEEKSNETAIGTATLSSVGTLTLCLRAEEYGENGELALIGHAYFEYKPDDLEYDDILEHIGEIEVGQDKHVLP